MGRLLVVLLFLLLIACPSFAGQPHFSETVSVTDVNTITEITGIFRGETVILVNDGPGTVYFSVADIPVATATGAGLGAGEEIGITAGGTPLTMSHVGLICAAGQTSTVRIFAFPTR